MTFVTDVYHGPSYRVAPPSTLRQLLPLNGAALTLTPRAVETGIRLDSPDASTCSHGAALCRPDSPHDSTPAVQ